MNALEMTPADLLPLAVQALEDADARVVLCDAIQEAAWFDPRVMQIVYPMAPYPPHGFRSQSARLAHKRNRDLFKTGFPIYFAGFVAAPTPTFARAVAAVLLFGGWRQRKWPAVRAREKAEEAARAAEQKARAATWRKEASDAR